MLEMMLLQLFSPGYIMVSAIRIGRNGSSSPGISKVNQTTKQATNSDVKWLLLVLVLPLLLVLVWLLLLLVGFSLFQSSTIYITTMHQWCPRFTKLQASTATSGLTTINDGQPALIPEGYPLSPDRSSNKSHELTSVPSWSCSSMEASLAVYSLPLQFIKKTLLPHFNIYSSICVYIYI